MSGATHIRKKIKSALINQCFCTQNQLITSDLSWQYELLVQWFRGCLDCQLSNFSIKYHVISKLLET
jgi:hypothetical protein